MLWISCPSSKKSGCLSLKVQWTGLSSSSSAAALPLPPLPARTPSPTPTHWKPTDRTADHSLILSSAFVWISCFIHCTSLAFSFFLLLSFSFLFHFFFLSFSFSFLFLLRFFLSHCLFISMPVAEVARWRNLKQVDQLYLKKLRSQHRSQPHHHQQQRWNQHQRLSLAPHPPGGPLPVAVALHTMPPAGAPRSPLLLAASSRQRSNAILSKMLRCRVSLTLTPYLHPYADPYVFGLVEFFFPLIV